jgi:hypothetical protein
LISIFIYIGETKIATNFQEEMISYAHVNDPKGQRYCQYKKDTLPTWAIDIQPYIPH